MRALTRSGRAEEALGEYASAYGTERSAAKLGELHLLRSAALLRLGRLDEADDAMLEARVAAYSARLPALEADFEATDGLLRYYQQDFSAACAAFDRALAVAPPQEPWPRPDVEYFLSLGLVRARTCDFRSLLARAKEGLRGQLHWATIALHELDGDPREDLWVAAWLLSNFAVLAVEIGDPGLVEEVGQRLSVADWAPGTQLQHFNAVRSSGWLRALSGDHLGAFRDFRKSAKLAPSPAWKLHSVLDRSFLAKELGRQIVADEELDAALGLSEHIDMTSTREAIPPFWGLLKLAELAASRDAAQGRSIFERYQAARSKCPPILFDGSDRMWRAREMTAEATVLRAEGRAQLAIDLFINAFDAFDKIGSRWRAAQVALELAEMSSQPFFYGYVAREAHYRPQSWLARRLAALPAKPL
ncbi:MAG: hypothetical protein ACLPSH_00045 [Vulcanimicrobiaceae bacterium]